MITQSSLIPQATPAIDEGMATPTAPGAEFISKLKANLMARNSNPINPMTNTEVPGSLEEALQVIEDQKRIINTLNAKLSGASSQRQMQS